MFRQTLAHLPGKTQRVEKPITESRYLTSYDFERVAFPLPNKRVNSVDPAARHPAREHGHTGTGAVPMVQQS